MAIPSIFFEWDDLTGKFLTLDRQTLVVGGTVTVHLALKQIGVAIPAPLNVPFTLMSFAGREIGETTLGAVRQEFSIGPARPLFIKPLLQTKTFAGFVLDSPAVLNTLKHLDDDLLLQTSKPVEFISEWRYYVHRKKVVGIAHYRGDWTMTPATEVVFRAISVYENGTVAYSLDFGITCCGHSLLVEANDAFSLGDHGIDAVAYAKMLEYRWLEITGG